LVRLGLADFFSLKQLLTKLIGIMVFMTTAQIFGFPETVNEKAARTVAAGVVTMVVLAEITHSPLFLIILLYGFVARVAAGPKFSPLGQFATRVVSPRLGDPKTVSGKPKRFAQGIGSVFSLVTLALYLFGAPSVAFDLLWILGAFALLESAFGICVGCKIFAILERLGIVNDLCEECGDIFSAKAAQKRAGSQYASR
jgi:hypothetical protein